MLGPGMATGNYKQSGMSSQDGSFDPDAYCPEQVANSHIHDRGVEENPEKRFVLTRPGSSEYVILSPIDVDLWEMFDGTVTTTDIAMRYLGRKRSLVLTRLYSLIDRLWNAGFLMEDPRMARPPKGAAGLRLLHAWHSLKVPVPGAGFISTLLGRILAVVPWTHTFVMGGAVLIAALGFVLFNMIEHTTTLIQMTHVPMWLDHLLREGEDYYVGGLCVLLVMHLILSFAHQLIRNAMTVASGGKSESIYLCFRLVLPVFHLDGHASATLPYRKRFVVDCSGSVFELMMAAGGAFILNAGGLAPGNEALVLKAIYMVNIRVFLHFAPFLDSDFSRALANLGGIRNLRRRALGFLRNGFTQIMGKGAPLTGDQQYYMAFNIVSAVWLIMATAFAVLMGIFFRRLGGNLLYKFVNSEQSVLSYEDYVLTAFLVIVTLLVVSALLACVVALARIAKAWLSAMPYWQHPLVILMVCVLVITGLFVGLVLLDYSRALPGSKLTQLGGWLTQIIVLAGSIYVVVKIRMLGVSTFSLKMGCLVLAVMFSTLAAAMPVMMRFADSGQILVLLALERGFYSLCVVLLVGVILISILSNLNIFSLRKTAFRLPELAILCGLLVLMFSTFRAVGAYSMDYDMQDAAGKMREMLEPAIAKARLVGAGLMLAGIIVSMRILKVAPLPGPSFAPDYGDDEAAISLKRVLAFVNEGLAQIIQGFFSQDGVTRFEVRINAATTYVDDEEIFTFSNLHLEEEFTAEAIGKAYGSKYLHIHEQLKKDYGLLFADRCFERVFQKVHWQGKALLNEYVLPSTRWAGHFQEELSTSMDERLNLINGISIFKELALSERKLLARHTSIVEYEESDLIYQQGDIGDSCSVVINGEVQVEETDITGEQGLVTFLRQGDFFGETALLRMTPRVASIRACCKTRVLCLWRADFESFATRYPEMVHRIKDRLQNLHELIKVPLFGDLPPGLLRTVLPRIRTSRYESGEIIIKQGAEGDEFFLIKYGNVDIIVEQGEFEEVICVLGPGDYFGEIALLKNIPRTATVKATRATEVLVLQKDDFLQLIHGSRIFEKTVNLSGEDRLQSV